MIIERAGVVVTSPDRNFVTILLETSDRASAWVTPQ